MLSLFMPRQRDEKTAVSSSISLCISPIPRRDDGKRMSHNGQLQVWRPQPWTQASGTRGKLLEHEGSLLLRRGTLMSAGRWTGPIRRQREQLPRGPGGLGRDQSRYRGMDELCYSVGAAES